MLARWALPMRRLWDFAEAVQERFHPDVIAVVGARRKDAVHVPGAQEIVFRRV